MIREVTYRLTLKRGQFQNGEYWLLQSDDLPGLFIGHNSLDTLMANFLPVWRDLYRLNEGRWIPEPPKCT